MTVFEKIIKEHRIEGKMIPGEEIGIKIDQTLTQDATGTMAYLEFDAMGVRNVRTKLSVSYVDHNTLQTGFENADDHRFLQSVAEKYGIYFSRPGNGICHQIHLERFAKPGETLLGSDSHTPNAGAMGMIAIGAGGLDVAVAMAGGPFYLFMPEVVLVKLKGKLKPWVSSKDVILELLKRLTVKGGVGKVFEYGGEGIISLTVPERATITNMGAELGATTSIFPSDEKTRLYLKAQKREKDWILLGPDKDASYSKIIEIDLSELEPLIAKPSSPDNISSVREIAGKPVDQVCIGSCNNSSYEDLMLVASILKGKKVHPSVSLTISPGSRQVLEMIARNGVLADLIDAGARILENACGPCIGMGQAPPTGGISIRTFNRNFPGRSGTINDRVYLANPAVAAASAIAGVITDPRELGKPSLISIPDEYLIDDSMMISPAERPVEDPTHREEVEVIRGPNIKPLPHRGPLEESLSGQILIKLGDNITTDDIMPAGTKILPLRSNIPAISEYVFERIDHEFIKRAKESGGGFIIGGVNYGQGSSREHAALAPMYLGIKVFFAKSFARIHRSNLINFGILPLTFSNEKDYNLIEQGDRINLPSVKREFSEGSPITVQNITKGKTLKMVNRFTERERKILLAGGLLNLYR
ncbi:MAG: aconitate hydratase [Nitrospirota bacterium]